jgi:hypothetical protein
LYRMTIGALITEAIICKKTANKQYRIYGISFQDTLHKMSRQVQD